MEKFTLLCYVLIFIVFANGLIADNEVVYLHMNESSWNGTADEVVDSSGNGNHGTAYGAANTTTNGRINNAGSFSGTSNDYVNCGNDDSLQSAVGSIEFWMKANSLGTTLDIINIFEDSWENYLLIRRDSNNKIRVLIEDNNVSKVSVYSVTTIRNTDWHHIVVTQNGTQVKIYIDGEESSVTGTNSSYWTNRLSLAGAWIGKGHWTAFDGLLDEVKIYDTALNADEVLENYFASEIRGKWYFDEGEGDLAADSSGWGNNGTIYGTTNWTTGKTNSAFDFDGSSNYVDCGSNKILKTATGSIEFWMQANNLETTLDIINIFEDSWENYLLIRRDSNNKIRVLIEDNNVSKVSVSSATTIADIDWHHIVVTQDGSGVSIYIDGQESSVTGTNSSYWTNHLNLTGAWIGKGHWSYFDGLLDEVKIYERALTSNEILGHYFEGYSQGNWHFDLGQGSTATDSSGWGNDGTIYGTANWVCEGRPGYTLDFDGSTNYIACGADASLQSVTGSIEFWVKADSLETTLDIINIFEDSLENYLLIRRDSNNKIRVLIEDNNVSKVSVSSATTIADIDWHHIVVTQDGSGVSIYIDGQESSVTGTNSSYWTNHLNLTGAWIGKGHWSYFDGLLDEVKIYERALTSDEVSQFYLKGGGEYGFGCDEYTAEPIGGGGGYSEIYNSNDADYYVDTQAELTTAIDSASSGDMIFIDKGAALDLSGITVPTGVTLVYDVNSKTELLDALGDTYTGNKVSIVFADGSLTIDLSGEENISISDDVILASDRGYNGSSGALIKTTTLGVNPLFCAGENVTITGLRVQGPGSAGEDRAQGVRCQSSNLEIENCEFTEWFSEAITLWNNGTNAYIHNNYIHGCHYGIMLGSGSTSALIKANKFDNNYHSIAGSGQLGNSFEACYNLVLENGLSHAFDMHGEKDFRKYYTSAIWRFDEVSGTTVEDDSTFYSNDGIIYGTLTWVGNGIVKEALEFDGSSTYVDFGTDSSLASDKGCIEFWMKADGTGTSMEIVNVYEDLSGNYLLIGRNSSNKIFVIIKSNNTETVNIVSDTAIADTNWHHIAVNQDGSGVDIYIDGQASTVTGTNSADWTDHLSLSGFWIGKGPAAYFDGIIDEVRIYSEELSADDISLHDNNSHADWAGDTINIHHNTFEITDYPGIIVRGIPNDELSIHHNWFFGNPDSFQWNAEGNLDVYMNLHTASRILVE